MKKLLLLLTLLPFSVLAQGYDPGYIEIDSQGSDGTIRMGETAELARFRLSNRTDKVINLNALRLRNYGSARLDESFENLHLTQQGFTVGRATVTESRAVHFTFDNLQIGRGDSVVLSVQGRLIYARTGRNVKLGIQYQEDVRASLQGLNYFSLECRDCRGTRFQTKTLKPGGIYLNASSPYQSYRYRGSNARTRSTYYGSRARMTDLSRYYRTPVGRQSYNPGARDITFFSSYLNSKADIRVEGVFLGVTSDSQVSDKDGNGLGNESPDFKETFSNFNLYVNGQREDSASSLTTYNGQLGVLFDATMDIPANSQLLMTGRITNLAVTGDKVKFGLGRDGLLDPVYLYSGDSVPKNNINGGSTSNFREVQGDGLDISR